LFQVLILLHAPVEFLAPVDLPHQATITQLIVYFLMITLQTMVLTSQYLLIDVILGVLSVVKWEKLLPLGLEVMGMWCTILAICRSTVNYTIMYYTWLFQEDLEKVLPLSIYDWTLTTPPTFQQSGIDL